MYGKIGLWLLCWVLVFVNVNPDCVAGEVKPSKLYLDFVESLRVEQSANKEWIKWQEEKDRLNEEILKLKLKIRYLQFKSKQLDGYIMTLSDRLDSMEQSHKEGDVFKAQLEPYLYEVVKWLEDFVKSDLPFFPEERAKRIEFLKSSLDDYSLSLSEKTRRILQAVIVEAKYGSTSDVTDQFIVLKKGEEPSYVQLLRIGRIGLFYLSPDSKMCGMYDRSSESWVPVSDYVKHNVMTAMEIVEGKKRADWVELPLQGITK